MNRYLLIFTATICMIALSGIDLKSEKAYTWLECVSISRRNHPELISAREKMNQKKSDVGIVRSNLLPQINATVNRSKSKTETGLIRGETDNYSYGITGKQLLFDGLKSVYDVKQARKMVDVSFYEYRVIESNLRLNLRNAFVQLLRSQESFNISKEIASRRKHNYNLVKLRYEAGREHNGSLLTAQAKLSQAEFEITRALRNISVFQSLLFKEMGLRNFVSLRVQGDFSIRKIVDRKPDFKKLANTNPLLQEIIHLKEAAEYGVKSAKMNFFPQGIRVHECPAGLIRNGPPANKEWSLGVEASFPIIEGGQRFYGVSKSRAEYRQLVSDARGVKDSVIFTLEQKWVLFQNSCDNVRVQLMFLNAAMERSKIAEAQYSIGIITFNNWIIIEDALANTMKSYLDARSSALLAEAEWIQAKGETMNYDK